MKAVLIAAALLFPVIQAGAQTAPIPVVAAENFYGDVVQQLGGAHVAVTSILTNPSEDPHLFEADAGTARALSAARLVIYNGADYDPWMEKLLAAAKSPARGEIVAAEVTGHKAGDNPHLWYDPKTMPAMARAIAGDLEQADPTDKADYEANLASFVASMQPLLDKVADLRQRFAGMPVTATEPVFGYMADALGLQMRNPKFQIAVMNDTEPSAADIAAFQNDLKQARVKALFYNSQASEELTQRMQRIAQDAKVPVIGVSETEPPGTRYQAWMLAPLDALDKAWSSPTP